MAIRSCIAAGVVPYIEGAPGIGKSAVVAQTAAAIALERQSEFGLRDVRVPLLDAVDLRGLPFMRDGAAQWARPIFLPIAGAGILFFDELSSAPPLVQAGCYQLIWDRACGEYRLPDDWHIVAAGNRASDKAVVNRMSTALGSRMVKLEFEIDHDDFARHALRSGFATEVIAFNRFRPELLHKFDVNAKAFPCPRTWEMVSNILLQRPDSSIEMDLYTGCVGQGAAAEFVGFLRVFRNLPSVDGILLAPDTAIVPTDPATLYAVCGALARRASDTNFAAVAVYAGRLPREFGVLLVKSTVDRCPAVQQTRAFQQWATDNSDVLI